MTTTKKLWAIGVFGASLWFGVSVMLGENPGAASGIGTFERLAALAAMATAEYGTFLTGLGVIVLGGVTSALCLIGGEGSPDAGWSDGDGGCD